MSTIPVKGVNIHDDVNAFLSARTTEEKESIYKGIMGRINEAGKYVRMDSDTLNLLAFHMCNFPSDAEPLSNILVRAVNPYEMAPEMKSDLLLTATRSSNMNKYQLFKPSYVASGGAVLTEKACENIIGALSDRGKIPRAVWSALKKSDAALGEVVSAFEKWLVPSAVAAEKEGKKAAEKVDKKKAPT
jgi:hypothetical protein